MKRKLEEMLCEIEEAKKEPLFRLCDFSYKDKQERIISRIEDIIRSHMDDDEWIPMDYPPDCGEYVLLSFTNFSLPMIGRYEEDEQGDGAYYLGDCDEEDTCASNDLYVNAWQPLPKPYRPEGEKNGESENAAG